MKRDECKATGRGTPAERKLVGHFDHLERYGRLIAEDRQNFIREWYLIRKLVDQYPELKRHVSRFLARNPVNCGIALVVDNATRRPAETVARHRPRQNDDGPDAA